MPAYKHISLDKSAGSPSTYVKQTLIKNLQSMQFETQVQTHIVYSTCLSVQSYLAKSEQLVRSGIHQTIASRALPTVQNSGFRGSFHPISPLSSSII